MTARAPDAPRVRYIGFRLEADVPVSRNAFIDAIRDTGRAVNPEGFEAANPWLTRYDGKLGILRCHHTHVDEARALLGAIATVQGPDGAVDVQVTTLATSGTIRTLTDKALRDLKDKGKRR